MTWSESSARKPGSAASPRSQLSRGALEALLFHREREGVVAAMVAAARALATDPDDRDEAMAASADVLPAENEALVRAEGRAAGNCGEDAQDERWWH